MSRVRDYRLAILLATLVLVGISGQVIERLSGAQIPAGSRDSTPELPAIWSGTSGLQEELAARFQAAVFMLHARNYEQAVTALHRVLELAPRLPEAHVNMGFALQGLERYAAARDFFQTAIELRPAQVNAYWGLATSLEALCDLAGARGAMRSYVHLTDADDPFLPRARAALWEWDATGTDTAGIPVAGCTPGVAQP